MKRIPVVFCFDDNLLLPAGVCIHSLLQHAHKTTFYHIFILHDSNCDFPHSGYLDELSNIYQNCEIEYRCVGSEFKDAFQIRGITSSTYYRLLIPEIVPEYDKLMYHDVDVIFRTDLTEIFDNTDLKDSYLAGVVAPLFVDKEMREYVIRIGLDPLEYVLAGNLIMNGKKMRDDGVVDIFKKKITRSSYKYQDMDIINIVCRGKIKQLPPAFCGTNEMFGLIANRVENVVYSQEELDQLEENGIIHYNGPKPWQEWCPNLDIWWEYYRKSLFYDPQFYFEFYRDRQDDIDRMTLKKRIKLLLGFFYPYKR